MKYIYVPLFFLLSFLSQAQSPKREFRGAWVATVSNIDFPSAKGLGLAQQKAEFVALLNQHQLSGINAIFVQIRCNSDAFYPTELAPWSEWLMGKQGMAPGYDPLAFMIAECKKRGIEFHAWFNPYRAVSNVNTSVLAANHIALKQPSWLLPYGNLRILDPGKPEVRNHVADVVMDVLRRYDIDGVHFDDYFYPYPQTGLTLNDDSTFVKNNRGFTNRADWRRDNVDLLIKQVSDSIKALKPYVKFGISPFGIWQNKTTAQPQGSATNGLQGYSDVFADSRNWVQKGWIDYIVPQLYWNIGLTAADYAILLPWWSSNTYGRHLYVGMGTYRIGASDSQAWQNPREMPTQMRLNRQYQNVQGQAFYNSTSVNKNLLGFRDSLRTNFYQKPALMPLMAWKPSTPPTTPANLSAMLVKNGIQLSWQKAQSLATNKVRGYVVYRFANDEKIDIENASALRYVTPNDTTAFLDETTNPNALRYTYVVTAIDRLHNESIPSNASGVVLINSVSIIAPQKTQLFQNQPNPFDTHTKIPYHLAEDSHVNLVVRADSGQSVMVLVNERQRAGRYEIAWNTQGFRAGVYVCTLEVGEIVESKKMVIGK